jgi:hypothetical protein
MGDKKRHHDDLDPEVERVVDELLAADRIIERYRERCETEGQEASFDPPGLMDRLMLVHTGLLAKSAGEMRPGPSPQDMMDKLTALRNGLSEELKAYVETLVGPRQGIQTWTPDECKRVDQAFQAAGLPALGDILLMRPADVARAVEAKTTVARVGGKPDYEQVRVENPAKVHSDFADVLFRRNVDERHAKRTLELLLTTPEGNELLKVMVYDAVVIQRKQAAAAKPPG